MAKTMLENERISGGADFNFLNANAMTALGSIRRFFVSV
jgi:hypothetical protein